MSEKPSKPVNGQRTFSAPGMAVHFQYPASFRPITLAPSQRSAGSNTQGTHAAVGIGDYDLLIVSRYPGLSVAVSTANIGLIKPQFDSVISQVLGRRVSGRVGHAGALPAIFWPRVALAGLPVKVSVMIVNAFNGHDEYELQCQATQKGLPAIAAACREMLSTLAAGAAQ